MINRRFVMAPVIGVLIVSALTGCASEEAYVRFSYVVDPERGLPPGMKTISIEPAVLGPATDPSWSDLCVRILQDLVNDAHNNYGAEVVLVDRIDTQATFDEADLRAAGMSTDTKTREANLLAVDGKIFPTINVKVEQTVGKESTISGLDLSGFRWGRGKGGSVDIETREVSTVTRTLTVQTDFKLVDTSTNRDWEHHTPRPFVMTDRTEASLFFGSSQTEAELTPRDRVIESRVMRGAKDFISKLLPCRIDVEAKVVSSGHGDCVEGVKLLRAEMYDEAIRLFRNALAASSDDHAAAFAAGIACEASGRYDEALRYYRRACAGKNSRKYTKARDRMKVYGSRIRG